MRAAAVVVDRFGPPEVLRPGEVDLPAPGPDQVLIAVEAVSVTFVDTQIRAGRPPNPAMAPELPYVPGNGVGGRVVAIGDRVEPRLLDARVVATTGGQGAYAQRVLARADDAVAIPDGLPTDDAVGLMADGRTAIALMRAVEPVRPRAVIVMAAAGGVGSCLVQLARHEGTTVIAAVGGQLKARAVEPLGPDAIVDYRQPAWMDEVRALPYDVDAAFDGVAGDAGTQAAGLVRPGGMVLRYGMASGEQADSPSSSVDLVRGVPLAEGASRELTASALALAAAGTLRPVIGLRLPLADAARAHREMEARAVVGKTLLH